MASDPNSYNFGPLSMAPQMPGAGYQNLRGWPYTTIYNPVHAQTGWGVSWAGQQLAPAAAAMGGAGAAAGVAQTGANLEAQALSDLLQDLTGSSIRKLYDYFSQYSERFPQLADGITLLSQAVELFKNRDYTNALGRLYDIYRYIMMIRAASPDLPTVT
jgi:fermentation-respiration switch protein FrsA (DUF1100 family)